MEKQLTIVGNSLALVIDKPLRKTLGIGRATRLRLWIDGSRLVVEPIRERAIPEAPQLQAQLQSFKSRKAAALNALDELVATWGLDKPRLVLLGGRHSPPLFRELLAGATDDLVVEPALDRLLLCVQALRVGRTWLEAIELARQAVPSRHVDDPPMPASGSFDDVPVGPW